MHADGSHVRVGALGVSYIVNGNILTEYRVLSTQETADIPIILCFQQSKHGVQTPQSLAESHP